MIEINLIPDVKQELLKAQRTRSAVISASIFTSFIAMGVVALLLVYIFGVQLARGIFLDDQITTKGAELSKVEDLSKILTIQNQLATISELNDSKNVTSRVFEVMSAITPPESNLVTFSQITVSPDGQGTSSSSSSSGEGQIHLEGQTTGYDSMEVFKKIVDNTMFEYLQGEEMQTTKLASNISTSDMSYGEDADGKKVLRFTLTFDYAAELLEPATSALSFKLDVDGNVTDSYLGIPRFADRAKDIEENN